MLCQRLHFCNLDVNNEADFAQLAALAESKEQVMVNYFAMPPMTYPAICRGLAAVGLNKQPHRVVMEKPIGTSLETSRQINDGVAEYFDESQVYRIDHYLGKETVLNLLALRFANSILPRNGITAPLIRCKLPSPKKWGLKAAGVTLTRPVRCVTWCKTTCCKS